LPTHLPVAIAQRTGQSGNDFRRAASAATVVILTNLIANFISGLRTNSLVSIVQSVHESNHDFGIADTVEVVAKLMNRSSAIFRVASGLRLINQLCNLARISVAATSFAAASAIVAATG